jgi:hypothetical protein
MQPLPVKQRRQDETLAKDSSNALTLPAVPVSFTNSKTASLIQNKISLPDTNVTGQVIQGVFLYSFISDKIINSYRDDAYYEELGFIRVLAKDGREVWTDRRNTNRVMELLGHGTGEEDTGEIVPEKAGAVFMFTIVAPTHDPGWQFSTTPLQRLNGITEAVEISLKNYNKSNLYVLTAPEYFFAAQNKDSHFMSKEECNQVLSGLKNIAANLPPNYVLMPGTIGYSENVEETKLEAEILKLKSRHAELLRYVASYKEQQDKEVEDNSAFYNLKSIKELYDFNWEYELTTGMKDKKNVKKIMNRAFVFYNQTMDFYDKMFESAEGETDKQKGDAENTLFVHGSKPFLREYNGIKLSLQVCSDLAFESLRGLDKEPDIQIIPASKYGSGGGFQQAKTLLLADSESTSLITKGDKEKTTAETPPSTSLKSFKSGTLNFFKSE